MSSCILAFDIIEVDITLYGENKIIYEKKKPARDSVTFVEKLFIDWIGQRF